MAGTVVIEGNGGSTFGAAIRGGDLVCKGDVGSRTGIDQKGGSIILGGRTGEKKDQSLPEPSQIQAFCQILMDYLSAGHFEVYASDLCSWWQRVGRGLGSDRNGRTGGHSHAGDGPAHASRHS